MFIQTVPIGYMETRVQNIRSRKQMLISGGNRIRSFRARGQIHYQLSHQVGLKLPCLSANLLPLLQNNDDKEF